MVLKSTLDNYMKAVIELTNLKTAYAIHLAIFDRDPDYNKINKMIEESQAILQKAKENLIELQELQKNREEWRKTLGKV